MARITVIGSLNMDLVVTAPKVPQMGETVIGGGFMTVPGGKGANQAVAAARLGADVAMAGCVGDDLFGADLLANLERNRVDTTHVKKIGRVSTGVAVIVVKDGDNFIIVDPGANSCLGAEDIDRLEKLILESFMVVVQLEIPLAAVERAVELARKHNVRVLLNPAPAQDLSDKLLSMVDIFTPNEHECEQITGLPVKSIDDAKRAVAWLKGKGIGITIVTMGGRGAVYNSGERIVHKPVPEVKVVDTTAAGDSFSGAIAVALSRGMDLDSAVDFANTVGAITVTRKGAQSSLPSLEDVRKFRGG